MCTIYFTKSGIKLGGAQEAMPIQCFTMSETERKNYNVWDYYYNIVLCINDVFSNWLFFYFSMLMLFDIMLIFITLFLVFENIYLVYIKIKNQYIGTYNQD